jgi:alkylhydroperoxidase family enzyme
MSRIEPLSAPYAPEVQASFDAIMPPGVAPLTLFRTLAASERAWRKFRAASLLDRGPLDLRRREIVIDRTCARSGCVYEWGVHIALLAQKAGLTAREVSALATEDADANCWTPAEAALIATADALHERASLDEGEWTRLRAHFDEAQALEALLLCGFYRTVAYVANGLDLTPEPFAAPLPAAVRPARETAGSPRSRVPGR